MREYGVSPCMATVSSDEYLKSGSGYKIRDVFTVEFENDFNGRTKYVALYNSFNDLYCTLDFSEWGMNFTYISEEEFQKRLGKDKLHRLNKL
jgi:hypothetical protein